MPTHVRVPVHMHVLENKTVACTLTGLICLHLRRLPRGGIHIRAVWIDGFMKTSTQQESRRKSRVEGEMICSDIQGDFTSFLTKRAALLSKQMLQNHNSVHRIWVVFSQLEKHQSMKPPSLTCLDSRVHFYEDNDSARTPPLLIQSKLWNNLPTDSDWTDQLPAT